MIFSKIFCALLFFGLPACYAGSGPDLAKPTAGAVSSGSILNWSLGLLIVLSVFFLCVWGVRKLNGLTVSGTEPLRIVAGLSLGMREKVLLLQVGKKQLVLGVTPGRIETLHVLENDDCLVKAQTVNAGGVFAQKLMQAMKGRSDE
jgi:flagellar protein FliO/FliZ